MSFHTPDWQKLKSFFFSFLSILSLTEKEQQWEHLSLADESINYYHWFGEQSDATREAEQARGQCPNNSTLGSIKHSCIYGKGDSEQQCSMKHCFYR